MGRKFETLAAAGAYLKICRQGVFWAIRNSQLKATRHGRRWIFDEDDLIAYLESKYDRKKKIFEGKPIVDHIKEEYTVMDIVLLFNDRIKRKNKAGRPILYKRQWLYHLIRKKRLPYIRRGILYIIKLRDAQVLFEEEVRKYPYQYKLPLD